jgi:uncharacterized protein YcaQ
VALNRVTNGAAFRVHFGTRHVAGHRREDRRFDPTLTRLTLFSLVTRPAGRTKSDAKAANNEVGLGWLLDFIRFGRRAKRARNEALRHESLILGVVVEEEFVGMRAEPECVVLLALGRDPRVQKVHREHVALFGHFDCVCWITHLVCFLLNSPCSTA